MRSFNIAVLVLGGVFVLSPSLGCGKKSAKKIDTGGVDGPGVILGAWVGGAGPSKETGLSCLAVSSD